MREEDTGQTAAPDIGETNRQTQKNLAEQRPMSRNHCRNQSKGRETRAATQDLLEAHVDNSESQNSRGLRHGSPTVLWHSPPGARAGSHSKCWGKKLLMLLAGKGEGIILNRAGALCYNEACPQEKLVKRILTCLGVIRAWLTWGKGNTRSSQL